MYNDRWVRFPAHVFSLLLFSPTPTTPHSFPLPSSFHSCRHPPVQCRTNMLAWLLPRWTGHLLRIVTPYAMPSLCGIAAIYLLTRRSRWRSAGECKMMSPDTVSSLFPDRPIRPLPKRRLRERLSPEAADSIKYPPSTLDNVPLFYYPPYTAKEDGPAQSNGDPAGALEHGRRPDPPSFQSLRNGVRPAAGEEQESGPRSTLVTRSQPDILTRAARRPSRPDPARGADPQPPPSAASSVDGYDSFENSNKKKRKIPSASDSVPNVAGSLSSDLSSLGISGNANSPTNDAGERLHHASAGYSAPSSYASTNQGFSGPGRGRLGRSRNGRSPLRALADGNSVWPGRPPKGGTSPWSPGTFIRLTPSHQMPRSSP